MKRLILLICAVVSCAVISSAATKKAIGFNTQINPAVTAVSYRFWSERKIGYEGLFGFSQGENEKYMDLGGKVLAKIRNEQNLTLYWFGMLGIENSTVKNVVTGQDNSETETIIGGGIGVEFFLQGLPNLGFGAEMGIANRNKAKITSLFSGWISSVGIRYYY